MRRHVALPALFLFSLVMILGFYVQAQATLILRGTDTSGNQLIYDTDLNITWYDYTHTLDSLPNQQNWANTLAVDFGGTSYSDWRLPVSDNCSGSDCTGSEMGHLYYTELGNKAGGPLSTSFTDGLTGNPESFRNLITGIYWSDTQYDSFQWWAFSFRDGSQFTAQYDGGAYALAVRPGDVVSAPVPEPATILLLGSGVFGLWRFRRKFRK